MSAWLPELGTQNRWLEALGGRRNPTPDSSNVVLRNPQFRAYADHMASEEFAIGIGELCAVAAKRTLAIMCSELLWWRCHRRLLADHLALTEGLSFHDGRAVVHPLTAEARRSGDHVVYDAVQET